MALSDRSLRSADRPRGRGLGQRRRLPDSGHSMLSLRSLRSMRSTDIGRRDEGQGGPRARLHGPRHSVPLVHRAESRLQAGAVAKGQAVKHSPHPTGGEEQEGDGKENPGEHQNPMGVRAPKEKEATAQEQQKQQTRHHLLCHQLLRSSCGCLQG